MSNQETENITWGIFFKMLIVMFLVSWLLLITFEKPNKTSFFSNISKFCMCPPSAIIGNQCRTFGQQFFGLSSCISKLIIYTYSKSIIYIDLWPMITCQKSTLSWKFYFIGHKILIIFVFFQQYHVKAEGRSIPEHPDIIRGS